jgi:hypothetical protein
VAVHRQDLPIARSEGLTAQELDSEILIYDHDTDVAHCLQGAAANVWRRCDGKTARNDLLSAELDSEALDAILEDLEARDLLVGAAPEAAIAGISRRAMVSRLAASAAAAPLIVSVMAPTAQAAGSCIAQGGACATSSQCCAGTVCCTTGSPGHNLRCFPSGQC